MIRYITLIILLLTNIVLGGVTKFAPPAFNPPLTLDAVKQGCSTTGIVNLQLVLNLKPGELVQFTLLDGKTYLYIVKSIEINEVEKSVRIYGDGISAKNSNFGFVFTKNGDIAGAMVLREEKLTYAIKLNESIGGYIFEKYIEKLTIQ